MKSTKRTNKETCTHVLGHDVAYTLKSKMLNLYLMFSYCQYTAQEYNFVVHVFDCNYRGKEDN